MFFPVLGVYAASHDLQIEWVVVKGISDYADGNKDSTEKWKPFASVMAASLVAHVLSQPSIFKDWPRYDEGIASILRVDLILKRILANLRKSSES